MRAALLRPTAHNLDGALARLVSLRDDWKHREYSPEETRLIRQTLASVGALAQQAQQLYGAMLAAGSGWEEADANYTPAGKLSRSEFAPAALSQIVHG
ncbi:MAG TPA: hypothetical protein VG672_26570 [Bryobacteraceae bacterium]|nr:hypothetical protein [Bryobacteraceae bacterium]